LARPEAKLELLQHVTEEIRNRAQAMCDAGRCQVECLTNQIGFHIDVALRGARHQVRCVVAGGHTNVVLVERDGQTVSRNDSGSLSGEALAYRIELGQMSMADVIALAKTLDADDREYLQHGVEMNLAISEWGYEVGGMAWQLQQMHRDGFVADDMFHRVKLRVASAVDARMTGMGRAVMTSGGSGNQGIVAILTPYLAGREMDVNLERIIESLAVTHLVNAYVKSFVGEISAICGCAMAAGIGSAAAIVYQQKGADLARIGMAVGNVVGDLCGLICDGAKPGCAMKAVTAVDSALRSALMALKGYGLSSDDGMIGHTIEDSLRNLGRMSREGMRRVDPTMLHILQDKVAGCRA
jgi:L-cysteine desulfidase